ncbi:MAG: HAD-like domain-containing protein [Monoraphidium minutum]|nr:MAG: HAD-like domain-containing protein [Monoraphidium minutum]
MLLSSRSTAALTACAPRHTAAAAPAAARRRSGAAAPPAFTLIVAAAAGPCTRGCVGRCKCVAPTAAAACKRGCVGRCACARPVAAACARGCVGRCACPSRRGAGVTAALRASGTVAATCACACTRCAGGCAAPCACAPATPRGLAAAAAPASARLARDVTAGAFGPRAAGGRCAGASCAAGACAATCASCACCSCCAGRCACRCACHARGGGAAAAPVAAPGRAAGRARRVAAAAGGAVGVRPTAALIFDCDGVIVETEELHRRAYNAAFEVFGLTVKGDPCVWDTKYYDMLQNTVAGGKGKMKYHFDANGWAVASKEGPVAEAARGKLVDDLQDKKTEVYKRIVEEAAEARPGILELMDEAIARPDIAVAICSAATKAGFEKVTNSVVTPERLAKFDLILAGDDVQNKKPDPEIYLKAMEALGVPAGRCLVIEDSMVGLRAATGAGMHCLITPTSSTEDQPFCEQGAAAVVGQLAGPAYRVGIDDLFAPCPKGTGVTVVNTEAMYEMDGNECAISWTANPFASTMMARATGWRTGAGGAARTQRAARLVAAPAAGKGFGKAPVGPLKDGCPCGSNKVYKDCCKPFHGGKVGDQLEDTLRARFSAVVKKARAVAPADVDYLMSTFHPEFSSVYFDNTAPGENWDKLRGEMKRTVDNHTYSNFKILETSNSEKPGEAYAKLQYSLMDKRAPQVDVNGKKISRVLIENARFLQAEGGQWQMADYRLVDVPAALVRSAEMETRDLKAQAEQRKAAAAGAAE